ncbi:MAG: guanylate kinase [Chloroflexi bacterium]|jgi:guanylate kinase|nr:MAG: guanylate kinase [Chloroflexota bacterium]
MMTSDNELNPLLRGARPQPLMLVISGPSGVGKDALLARLRECDEAFQFVVTATSRPPRPNEVDGVDYFFYDTAGFEALIAQNELVEWAEVYGHYKGIPKQSIRSGLDSGHNVILRIDVQGAATLKRLVPGAIQVFLAPGSMDELKQRLLGRGTESPEQFARRLTHAEREMAQVGAFDYVVFNRAERLDDAVAQIQAIIKAEQQRVRPRRIAL